MLHHAPIYHEFEVLIFFLIEMHCACAFDNFNQGKYDLSGESLSGNVCMNAEGS